MTKNKLNKWHLKNKDEEDENILTDFFQTHQTEKHFIEKLLDTYVELSLWILTVAFIVFAALTQYNKIALLSIISAWSAVVYRKYIINGGQ